MNFLYKLERKFGKFAIPNLIVYLLAGYVIGYTLSYIAPGALYYLTLEPYYILHGQVWRLITWVLIPPSRNLLFAVIMIMFYFQLGRSLEHVWGTFRFNLYIFGGIIFTIIGAFILYGVGALMGYQMYGMGWVISTDYINMGIFLAYALCFPEMQVLLYFVIPVKMKWMAWLYVVLIAIDLFQTNWAGRVVIIASLLNFIVFYLSTRNYHQISPKEIKRKRKFRAQMRTPVGYGVSKHKCAICGRTEKDDPNLEFRFCSKCAGNYEYCQDHLFTHNHVRGGN
ncbi:MAG: hypothetical protein NC307_05405 [Roseburia sp.]|nr:hypothetical protein [Roseburia sp.]